MSRAAASPSSHPPRQARTTPSSTSGVTASALRSPAPIEDTEVGGHYTLKRYTSEKAPAEDGSWRHTRIVLRPDTDQEGYEPIVLEPEQEGEVRVVAELLGVI